MINIGEDYWISSDEHAFRVARKQYVKDGKTKGTIRWVDMTWHSTFGQLKDRVACLGLKTVDENTERLLSMLDNFILQETEIKNLKQ